MGWDECYLIFQILVAYVIKSIYWTIIQLIISSLTVSRNITDLGHRVPGSRISSNIFQVPTHGMLILYPKIFWVSQKTKTMFHVFQYGWGRGGCLEIFMSPKAYMGKKLRIFPIIKAYIEGEKTLATTPNTRTSETYCCKFTERVWSLYGGDKRITPRTSLRSKEWEAQHFFISQSLYRGRAENFYKSQSLGGSSVLEFFQVPRPI